MSKRRCFICACGNPNVIETHHIVPRRYGGGDTRDNTVELCSNCHTAIEKIYSIKKVERIIEAAGESKTQTKTLQDSVGKYCEECLNTGKHMIHVDDIYKSYKEWCFEKRAPLITSQIDFRSCLELVDGIELHHHDKFGWVCNESGFIEAYAPENQRKLSI